MTDDKLSDEQQHENMAVLSNFDQTNGVIEGLEGESDGTAEGEQASGADREAADEGATATDRFGGDPSGI